MQLIAFARLVRAPAGFTAASNIIAAAVIASHGVWHAEMLLLILASLCFYYAGMILNDCFDYQEDLIANPSRPIPSGKVAHSQAWGLGFLLLFCGLMSAYFHSITAFYIGLALSTSIILYNSIIKNGLLGSACMASCRYINWILGASILPLGLMSWLYALPIFFYITGLTYVSKQEMQANNKSAINVCAAFITLTVAALIYLVIENTALSSLQKLFSFALIMTWSICVFYKLSKVYGDFSPQTVQQLITYMIIGVIPLDALIVAISGHYLISVLVLSLLYPCRVLSKQLYIT